MSYEINLINNYKRSLIILLTVPFLLIGCIYISYGEILDGIILQHHRPLKWYQLHLHLVVFNGDYWQFPLKSLPQVTSSIGYYSVIAIFIFFFVWLVLFSISSYLRLAQQVGAKAGILGELFILLAIYIISINPGLNLWLSLFGYIIIAVVFVMLTLYWIYEIKTKR